MLSSPIDIAEGVSVGGGGPLMLIAGPDVVESEEHALKIARALADFSQRKKIPLVYKSSFDKANRTSVDSPRGPGMKEGLRVLASVKRETGLPVTTDFHLPSQAEEVAEVADLLQIPAFLCRQTDMLIAAGRTGRPVNVKKGQFLAPQDISHAVEKVRSTGNDKILLTERGTTFGWTLPSETCPQINGSSPRERNAARYTPIASSSRSTGTIGSPATLRTDAPLR